VVSSPTNITAYKDFARVEMIKSRKDDEDLDSSNMDKYLNFNFTIKKVTLSEIQIQVDFEFPEYVSYDEKDRLNVTIDTIYLRGMNWRYLTEYKNISIIVEVPK
jgi:hypothetical protein